MENFYDGGMKYVKITKASHRLRSTNYLVTKGRLKCLQYSLTALCQLMDCLWGRPMVHSKRKSTKKQGQFTQETA